MMRYIFIALFTISCYDLGFTQEQIPKRNQLSVEKIWENYLFISHRIDGFRSMNDGTHYTRFVRENRNMYIIKYAFHPGDKSTDTILNCSELTYDNQSLYVDDYQFNEDETKLLLTVNRVKRYRRSFFAEYYIYDLTTNELNPLDNIHVPQMLASFSPDGKKVAYIFENNLYVKSLKTNEVKEITTNGKNNAIINGTTDWVYEEEFAITKAYDWSPNSQYIAFLCFDETKVKEFTMMYFHNLYPQPYKFKYPKAGEDNSVVTLKVADLKSNSTTDIDLGEYEYIPRLKFSTTVNKLIIQTLNRHQNHIQYHWVDTEKEGMPSKVVYEEKSDTYLSIDDDLYFFKDGKHFIRTSQKDGFNHIYKIGVDGSTRQITHGDWEVISFQGIKEGTVYYTSAEEGAQYSSLYSIQLNGKNKKKLSDKKGYNEVTFSDGMHFYVNKWSNINTPPVYTLHSSDGKQLKVLEDNSLLQDRIKKFNFQQVQFRKLQGKSTPLNAWILYPSDFDSTQHYPVYFHIYGGPGSNMVLDQFGAATPYDQLLAQKGYIVISVDPRGTLFRGADFQKSTYLQLGKLETEDMISVAKQVGKWPFVDSTRIGVMGWSYGGYLSSLCITKGADVFKMAIAVAPVTNWRYYDNIYTERYMRTPQENTSGYDDNSPINFVQQLKGNYLIVHGSGDDNVHVQNTYEMVNALINANKNFDMMIYPNKNHGIYGGFTRSHLFRKMLNFTLENL